MTEKQQTELKEALDNEKKVLLNAISEHKINTDNSSKKEMLIEYRLNKLEEAVDAFKSLSEVVMRWDVKFQNINFLQCPIHNLKILDLEEKQKELNVKIEVVSKDVSDIKKFIYRIGGAICVITFIIQLLSPVIVDYIHPNKQQVTTSSSTFTTSTPSVTIITNK